VNLDMLEPGEEDVDAYMLDNRFLKSEYLLVADCIGYEEMFCEEFEVDYTPKIPFANKKCRDAPKRAPLWQIGME